MSTNKIKKYIYEGLFIDNEVFKSLKTQQTIHNGKKSDWSLAIEGDSDCAASVIAEAFHIKGKNKEAFDKAYTMITSGTGAEGGKNDQDTPKILRLNSSSLLTLLCFFAVSKENPLTIDEIVYTRAFFEIQNDVFVKSNERYKPSNIDVVLVSEDEKKILFLESKFTEFFEHGKTDELSERYFDFYTELNPKVEDYGFEFSHEEHNLYCGEKTYEYLNGIKQLLSHLIGMTTGPKDEQFSHEYAELYEKAEVLELATILFSSEDKDIDKYSKLYSKVFDINHVVRIKEVLSEVFVEKVQDGFLPKSAKFDNITVRSNALTYQQVFKEQNQSFSLPDKVRAFYKLNSSPLLNSNLK